MADRYLRDFSQFLAEWDHEKNPHLDTASLTLHSTKKAWWKCRLGHSYLQPIYVHTRGSGCPYCGHRKVLKGFNDLASQSPVLASQMDPEKNGELSPDMIMVHSNRKIWWKCPLGHSWKASPNTRSRYTGSGCPYCSNKLVLAGFNDLASRYPGIASEWDFEKNPSSPEEITPGSCLNAWWMCPKGHSYQMAVHNRTGNGFLCPVCSGHRIIAGINDLATLFPKLASEWDCKKNGPLSPDVVTAGSKRSVWWKCPKGHSFRAAIRNRSNGSGCPYCGNHRILPGFNDLLTRHPYVKDYWDYDKNISLDPGKIMPSFSRQKIWWKCSKGHNWRSCLSSFLGTPGCPVCDGRRKPERIVCLSEGYPEIAAEWDYEKNGLLSPDEVTAGSNRSVWWKCPKGHSYNKRVCRRVFKSSCPYCSGWSLLAGVNDLETVHPEIAADWDLEKNFPLTPRDVSRASSRKAWWICPRGHSYRSTIASRTITNQKCPYCMNRKVLAGFNDLETIFPDVSNQWDHEKNGSLLPGDVVAKSSRRVWWKCDKGHSWEASVVNRTSQKTGCPYCCGLRVIPGETDFATANPSLLKEWDYEKNGNVSPFELTSKCAFVAWWKCDNGHSWQSPVYSRTDGESCPFCQPLKSYYSRLI